MLGAQRRFVDTGRQHAVRLDAGLLQQLDPTRRTRGKHELRQSAHRDPGEL